MQQVSFNPLRRLLTRALIYGYMGGLRDVTTLSRCCRRPFPLPKPLRNQVLFLYLYLTFYFRRQGIVSVNEAFLCLVVCTLPSVVDNASVDEVLVLSIEITVARMRSLIFDSLFRLRVCFRCIVQNLCR